MNIKQTFHMAIAFLLSVLMLVSATGIVSATHLATPQYDLDRVEIDGEPYNDLPYDHDQVAVLVTRGESLDVDVFFHGESTDSADLVGETLTNNARVSAELVGYEYGDISDETGLFEVLQGVYDHKKLTLKIPEDLRASDSYKLRVVLEDDNTEGLTQFFTVQVEEPRHFVNTFDLIVNPPGRVQAGQPLFVTARLENLGATLEESVKVTASIPALGVQASEFVNVLATEEQVRDENDRRSRDAVTTNDLMLTVPADAKPGEYLMSVLVQYNRYHSKQEKLVSIVVEGKAPTATVTPKSLVSVDNAVQRAEVGKGAVYKVSVANLEGVAKTYTVMVTGVGSWGSYRVDPLARTVEPDQTAEFNVFVSPVDGAPAGTNTFSVSVQDASGKVAGQASLSLEVSAPVANDTLSASSVKRALEVGFVVLLVILVILGIVIIAKKLAGDEEEEHTGRGAKKSYY